MKVIRIAMWSGPRNMSTAMMRSFENRSDTEVLDEPLYAMYLAQTGLNHPVREAVIAAGPVEESAAIARCLAAPSSSASVSYQKHMSHHLLASTDRSWIDELTNFLLIRHPARVLASYVRKRDETATTELTLDDIGLPQQLELFTRLDPQVLVIDSDDFLRAPRAYLEAICHRSGIEFQPSMLSWPTGRRTSDGVWAEHWYDQVDKSTGFGPPPAGEPPDLDGSLRPLLVEAAKIYEELSAVRLRL